MNNNTSPAPARLPAVNSRLCRLLLPGLILAVLLGSCGIPLAIPADLRDQAALVALMNLERTVRFTGASTSGILDLLPARTEFGQVPLVFPVPGGPTFLLVPRTGRNTNPFASSGTQSYASYTQTDGSTGQVSAWPGLYVFCLQNTAETGTASATFQFARFSTGQAGGQSAAFMYLPVQELGNSAVPYRLGLLGLVGSAGQPDLKAAVIHRAWGPDGNVHQYLSFLDNLPVFSESTITRGLPVPFTLVDSYDGTSLAGSNRIFGGLDAPDTSQIAGINFAPARLAAGGERGYGLAILTNRNGTVNGWSSLPWQGGGDDWFAVTGPEGYWPWTAPASSPFATATNDLSQPSPVGFGMQGLLATTHSDSQGTSFFLCDNNVAVTGQTIGTCAFNAAHPLGGQSFQWDLQYPLLRFLNDGSPVGWNGSTWALASLADAASLQLSPSAGWTGLSLPGLQFLYEHHDGTEWRLWFCQTLVQRKGSNWDLVFRIYSLPVTAWKEWFAARAAGS